MLEAILAELPIADPAGRLSKVEGDYLDATARVTESALPSSSAETVIL